MLNQIAFADDCKAACSRLDIRFDIGGDKVTTEKTPSRPCRGLLRPGGGDAASPEKGI